MHHVKSLSIFGVEAKQIPCITGSGAPTSATEGAVGCLYMDTATGDLYKRRTSSGGWQNILGNFSSYASVVSSLFVEECFSYAECGVYDGTGDDEADVEICLSTIPYANLIIISSPDNDGEFGFLFFDAEEPESGCLIARDGAGTWHRQNVTADYDECIVRFPGYDGFSDTFPLNESNAKYSYVALCAYFT